MNYWVYFNENPVIDPADLLVMDDAHLAEHCLHSLYSVEFTRYAHKELFENIVRELQVRFPEYAVLADALVADTPPVSATELLSFIDQCEVVKRIREIVDESPLLDSDKDLSYRWARLRNRLKEVNIYLGLSSLWFRPYVYPLIQNLHYIGSTQRLFMSATIGDPADLSRRLGVKEIRKIPVAIQFSQRTTGRRLIVMNRVSEDEIAGRLALVILTALRVHPKSVWLCTSEAQARAFEELVKEWLEANGLGDHPTWLLTPLGDEIDQFKRARTGHLFVAGRFDGMDFSADECRLVVVTSLPRAINQQEEFVSTYLRDSGFMVRRLNGRIVQALGRCNRGDEDYGVYVLVDRKFASHFSRESNKLGIPRNIVAELDMAQDAAEIDESKLAQQVATFLKGKFADFDSQLDQYLSAVPAKGIDTIPENSAADEVIGWASLFEAQNYTIAADRFERCWELAKKANLFEIAALYGWQWAKAHYLQSELGDLAAREKALTILDMAIKRGGQSSWFNRMRGSLNRARQKDHTGSELQANDYREHLIRCFDDVLEKVGVFGERFEKWCGQITDALKSTSHAQFQEGLVRLGDVCGYTTARPKYAGATDCRWRGVFGNHREVITFEAKIENDPANAVSLHDVGQASGQFNRAKAEFESAGYTIRSVIATHLNELEKGVTASIGPVRILQKDAVIDLWTKIKSILSIYRDRWSLEDPKKRIIAANYIRTKLPATGWLARALDKDNPVIAADDFLREWNK